MCIRYTALYSQRWARSLSLKLATYRYGPHLSSSKLFCLVSLARMSPFCVDAVGTFFLSHTAILYIVHNSDAVGGYVARQFGRKPVLKICAIHLRMVVHISAFLALKKSAAPLKNPASLVPACTRMRRPPFPDAVAEPVVRPLGKASFDDSPERSCHTCCLLWPAFANVWSR